jgi:hypothetical protein
MTEHTELYFSKNNIHCDLSGGKAYMFMKRMLWTLCLMVFAGILTTNLVFPGSIVAGNDTETSRAGTPSLTHSGTWEYHPVLSDIHLFSMFTSSEPTQYEDPPPTPANPKPEHGSTNVAIENVVLIWTDGDSNRFADIVYDIYFGRDDTPSLVAKNIVERKYEVEDLNPDTQYFWRIVARNNYGQETSGPVWHFTTGLPENYIWISPHLNGCQGEDLVVPVMMVNADNNEVKQFHLSIKYDTKMLEYAGCASGNLTEGWEVFNCQELVNKDLFIDGENAEKPIGPNSYGSLAQLFFRVACDECEENDESELEAYKLGLDITSFGTGDGVFQFTGDCPPTPTPDPDEECDWFGTRLKLSMPGEHPIYRAGDTFWLECQVCVGASVTDVQMAIVLGVFGEYWFWPSWSIEFDRMMKDYEPGLTTFYGLEPFIWPEVVGEATGLEFYAAMLNQDTTWIFGDEFGHVFFGYQGTEPDTSWSGTVRGNRGSFYEFGGHHGWLDTGIDLVPGQTYFINVDGQICFYPPENCAGGHAQVTADGYCPDGDCRFERYCDDFSFECSLNNYYPFLKFPHASLLARQGDGDVFDEGRVFKATEWHNGGQAQYAGRLYLLIYDYYHYADNTGGFDVYINW